MRRTLILLLALFGSLMIVGCSSKNRQVNNPDNKQWFCQSNESGEGWECVQDDLLAQRPVPTRMPPVLDVPQSVESDVIDPLGLDAQADALQSDPAATTAVGLGDTDAVQQQAPVATSGVASTEEPLYVQLAYVPPEPVSIMELPADYFAVQVLAMPSREQLEAYVVDNGISGMSAARVESNGALQYVLLLGVYTTRERATLALSDLPSPLGLTDSWIRPLSNLQEAISSADRLAGRTTTAVDP